MCDVYFIICLLMHEMLSRKLSSQLKIDDNMLPVDYSSLRLLSNSQSLQVTLAVVVVDSTADKI